MGIDHRNSVPCFIEVAMQFKCFVLCVMSLFRFDKNSIFYVLLTVHLSITLVNDQLDAQFFYFIIRLITVLYMFQATSCSSSGGQIVLIQHLVSSLSVSGRPVNWKATYSQ